MRSRYSEYARLSRITNIVDDWLTPVEYLPYIDAVLGDIELDPCSTELANKQFLRAKQIYTYADDGLNIEVPWCGKTYLFPPTYGRCSFSKERGTWRWSTRAANKSLIPSVAWFKRLEKEWKLRNIPEALFYSTSHEMLRTCPSVWDYPICIPYKRGALIHGKRIDYSTSFTWGFFVYLPKSEYGFSQAESFIDVFSNIGKLIY